MEVGLIDIVGSIEGTDDGEPVGAFVSPRRVGDLEGDKEAMNDGTVVGTILGESEMSIEGLAEGTAVEYARQSVILSKVVQVGVKESNWELLSNEDMNWQTVPFELVP